MRYSVLVEESEEGFADPLPGCHCQGGDGGGGVGGHADATGEYLEVADELARSATGKRGVLQV